MVPLPDARESTIDEPTRDEPRPDEPQPDEPTADEIGSFGRALLNALPARTAVVDRRGAVLATNINWQTMRWPEGVDMNVAVGDDLVARLRRITPRTVWRKPALELAAGVERLLAGEITCWERVVDGAGPAGDTSWHMVQVLPLAVPGGGAVISISEVTDQVRAERQLQWQATHDPLTGLANRARLIDRLQQALRRGAASLVVTDLDRFTVLNDSLGPDAGDYALREVANRLKRIVGPVTTLARVGGDSFAIVLERADALAVEHLVNRIDEAMRAPFVLGDREVLLTTASGAVLVPPVVAATRRAEDLVSEAEAAVRRAAVDGRLRSTIVEAAVPTRSRDALDTEQDLRRALERDELALEYQPEVSIETGQVLGAEALLRWHHPTRGVLAPQDFLRLAEQTGLIVPIGHWTLQQACRDAAAWVLPEGQPGGSDATLFVGVNLSARQIADPELLDVVDAALAATGLPSRRLCVEVTETALFEDFDEAVVTLRALRGRGVRIALDDFGTGYSSLSYLKELPVDVLKIDRSFVDRLDRDHRDRAVVSAVVTLARVFGLQVVAEGVEGADQLARLRHLGVHVAQGFDVARPSDAGTMAAFAREGLPTAQ